MCVSPWGGIRGGERVCMISFDEMRVCVEARLREIIRDMRLQCAEDLLKLRRASMTILLLRRCGGGWVAEHRRSVDDMNGRVEV